MSHVASLRRALQGRTVRWSLILTATLLAFPASPPLRPSAARAVQADQQTTGDSAEHAAEDLAGTSIDRIERQTTVNADRILRQTGRRPGVAVKGTLPAAVSADPGVSGQWS